MDMYLLLIYLIVIAASIVLPFVSMGLWAGLLLLLVPAAREAVGRLYLTQRTLLVRVLTITALITITAVLGAASMFISFIIELIIMMVIAIVSMFVNITGMLLAGGILAMAGPIEESAKFLCMLPLLVAIWFILSSQNRPLKRSDAMLSGMAVGAFFGMGESTLYILDSGITVIQEGWSIASVDALLSRFFLGVMLHALLCALASAGTLSWKKDDRGAYRWRITPLRVLLTLPAAMVIHTLMNLTNLIVLVVPGYRGLIAVDVLQFVLAISLLTLVVLILRNEVQRAPEHPAVW